MLHFQLINARYYSYMFDQELFYTQATEFLERLFEEVKTSALTLNPHWSIDHICYRTESLAQYKEGKRSALQFSDMIHESKVNGRDIAIFKLHTPLLFWDCTIDILELPAPKQGSSYAAGFEHIEMVCDEDLSVLKSSWQNHNPELSTKELNPELKVAFPSGSIKFHNMSLVSLIHLETNRPVFQAIENLKIINDLKSYSPQIVGTFPLALETPQSDVDIVVSHTNLEELKHTLIKYYSHLPQFHCHSGCILDSDSLTCGFTYKNIPFEIFAQTKNVFYKMAIAIFISKNAYLKLVGLLFMNVCMPYASRA